MGFKTGYSLQSLTRLLTKVQSLDVKNTGWQKISSNAQEPVFLDRLLTPGNYSISYWRQGPASVTSKVPINISVSEKNSSVYQTVFYMTHVFERVYDGPTSVFGAWAQLQNLSDSEFGPAEPSTPSDNMIWFDTRSGQPKIRTFNAALGRWEPSRPEDMILLSVYDPTNKQTDFYAYVTDQISDAGLIDAHTDFVTHINNSTLHITEDERNAWDGAADQSDMEATVIATRDQVKSTVAGLVNDASDSTDSLLNQLSTVNATFTAHVNDTPAHPNAAKQADWMSKADGNHTHNLDGRVTINASDIVEGIIPAARFPAAAMERGTTVATEAARLALTASSVQDGDSVYVTESQMSYFVIDQTKLGTADKENAFVRFSEYQQAFTWANLSAAEDMPTTIKGFGIVDAYDNDDLATLIDEPISGATQLQSDATDLKNWADTVEVDANLPTQIASAQSDVTDDLTAVNALMTQTGLTY